MLQAVWHRMFQSRSHPYLFFGAVLSAAIVVGWFWSDFCLWRADASLVLRQNSAAQRWIEYSRWGRKHDARLCELELKLARRQLRFHDVERLLQEAPRRGVAASQIQRERLLAMAQIQQFDQVSRVWPDLFADPRDDEPEIARAFVIWASSRHMINDAVSILEIWQKDYPNDPEPFALHGQLDQAMNHDEGAVNAYRKALALAPDNDEYRRALAQSLTNLLQLDEALTLFRECVAHNPDNLPAIRGLAQVYTSKGELDKAVTLLTEALKRFPDDIDIQLSLGDVYVAQGNAAAALPLLEHVHQLRPEDANLAYSLARVLKTLNRDADAAPLFAFVAKSREPLNQLKSLEEQFRKTPTNVDLLLQIAQTSAKYKSRVEAIRWLEKLLLLAPNNRAAQDALHELKQAASSLEDRTGR